MKKSWELILKHPASKVNIFLLIFLPSAITLETKPTFASWYKTEFITEAICSLVMFLLTIMP